MARNEDSNDFADDTDIEIVIQGIQPSSQARNEPRTLDNLK